MLIVEGKHGVKGDQTPDMREEEKERAESAEEHEEEFNVMRLNQIVHTPPCAELCSLKL